MSKVGTMNRCYRWERKKERNDFQLSYIGLVFTLVSLVIVITTLALHTQSKIKFGVEAFGLSIILKLQGRIYRKI